MRKTERQRLSYEVVKVSQNSDNIFFLDQIFEGESERERVRGRGKTKQSKKMLSLNVFKCKI